jgi:hypothetical protein
MSEPNITPENVARMLDGVTPGPWCNDETGSLWNNQKMLVIVCDEKGNNYGGMFEEGEAEANLSFIAWSREAIPAYAARLAEVESDLVQMIAIKDIHAVKRMENADRAEAAERLVSKLRAALSGGVLTKNDSLDLLHNLAAAEAKVERLRAALVDTLDFVERHSNRWDVSNGKHPALVVETARAALSGEAND